MAALDPVVVGSKNQRLRQLRRLTSRAKVRSEERAFVVDGPVLVADVLRSPLSVLEVFGSSDELYGEQVHAALLQRPDVEVFQAEASVLESILDPVNPRPLAAVVTTPAWTIEDLGNDLPLLVAVELRNPGNMGTVMRTAEAAGFGGVVVVGDSVDWVAPKVVRASAGSLFRIPVVRFDDVEQAYAAIRDSGRQLYSAVVDQDAEDYVEVDLRSAAIVVGNEPHGLAPEAIKLGDGRLTIPVAETVESLNVAAAASVLCFEAARQRRVTTATG